MDFIKSKKNVFMKKIFLLCITLFLCHAKYLYAQSLTHQLKHIERLVYSNVEQAGTELKNIELQLMNANNSEKIHWYTLSIQIAAFSNDEKLKQQIAGKLPYILQDLAGAKKHLWQKIFTINFQLLNRGVDNAINQLQSIESQVKQVNDEFMLAYFNRVLYYSFILNGIYDVAMDIAIENEKQWQAIDEHYLALEMQFRIIELKVRILNIPNAEQVINDFANNASKLEITKYDIPLTLLKSRYLAQNGQINQAYDLLKNLIDNKIVNESNIQYPGIIHQLADYSYQLKAYKESITLAREALSFIKEKSPEVGVDTKIILAKALIEEGNFTEAKQLVDEAKVIFTKYNNSFGLFVVDNIYIDILYKDGDFEALYQTTKNMIQTLENVNNDNHGERRVKRAENAAYVNEQNKVVEELAQSNISQQQEIDYSKELLSVKNNYLTVMALFCFVLFLLLIWLYYLLKKVHKLANTDSLTGIRNRRSGIDKTTKLIKKARINRQKGEIAVAMLDLDDFKSINDTYGHDIGDKVIQSAVEKAQKSLDAQDIICRMGGEEFLIVLTNKTKQQISEKIEQIRQDIHQSNVAELGILKPLSVSIGITTVSLADQDKSLNEYLIDADTALYCAKNSGKNQVQEFQKAS
ncbi:GGDEF domain-containing protein [Colwelliaceae bacterium 6441]